MRCNGNNGSHEAYGLDHEAYGLEEVTSMNRKRISWFLPVALPVIAALLGGLHYADQPQPAPISMAAQNAVPVTAVAPPTPVVVNPSPAPVVVSPSPAPVVVSPAPAPVVVAPAPTTTPVVVSPAPSTGYPTVINYAEGRYPLYADAGSGYYWVWIPSGTTAFSPPLPPAVPRANVVLTPAQRQIVYQEGRYVLYGDSTSGYYWAWIPSGMTPPVPPPPWRVSQQR